MIAAEERRAEALAIAQQLREEGWRVGVPLGQEKVGKQFGSAETAGASHAIVIGSEWPTIKVKRLSDRVEEEVSRETLPAWIAKELAR